jgi:hypothetical protein
MRNGRPVVDRVRFQVGGARRDDMVNSVWESGGEIDVEMR